MVTFIIFILGFLGSCCNFDPNACCNYLQTACLPDPIKSGVYTCQKVDTYRPRLAPLSFSLPNGYGSSYGTDPVYGTGPNYARGSPYGINQNYATEHSYANSNPHAVLNEPPRYAVQRAAPMDCGNTDGTPGLIPAQCPPPNQGARRALHPELANYELIVRDVLERSQAPIPHRIDSLNYGPLMGTYGYAGRK